MDEKDKKEVENMILKAKLDISESRFKLILYLAGGFLALFGVMLPIFLSWDSSGRVDKSIAKMENSFKELAGLQLRKPDIECYFEGKRIDNGLWDWSFNQGKRYYFEVRNTGEATAKDLQIYCYVPDVEGTGLYLCTNLGNWDLPRESTDETVFSKSFKYRYPPDSLNPKEPSPVSICFFTDGGKECKATVLLKIYYGQPEPKNIPFNVIIKSQ